MNPDNIIAVHWFRRDLRLHDNAALYHALKSGYPVLPVFIFDRNILEKLEDRGDRRVQFIYREITRLQQELTDLGSSLLVLYGSPEVCWNEILCSHKVAAVYTNHDYEPYARARDLTIKELLEHQNIEFHSFKDQVIFEKDEVIKEDGNPYTVYTPYSRKWKAKLNTLHLRSYTTEQYFSNFFQTKPFLVPDDNTIGFHFNKAAFPDRTVDENIITQYAQQRDYPSLQGTTKISVHLRFGTISIRDTVRTAQALSDTWLNELCWREFYMCILWHYPEVVNQAFKPAYNRIRWRNNEKEFEAWCEGRTGYPIVDAGMRELNETGFMHNRLRMIVASFLTKHLLIDWRWGEAYFAKKLLDFDLAANNGGWQWAAGTGCDAAPYFRIFNPYEQTKKFDPEMKYIRRWVPEFQDFGYPQPIVDHKQARERCLATYAVALRKGNTDLR